jgi:hypothetical protein
MVYATCFFPKASAMKGFGDEFAQLAYAYARASFRCGVPNAPAILTVSENTISSTR